MGSQVRARSLDAPVATLRGVGPALATKLERIGVRTVQDLLLHLPMRYQDRTRVTKLRELTVGTEALIEGRVVESTLAYGRRRSWTVVLDDASSRVLLRFFHFSANQRAALSEGLWVRAFGEARMGPRGVELIHPEYKAFPARPPPPEGRLTPVYPSTEGLTQKRIASLVASALERLARERAGEVTATGRAESDAAIEYLHRPPEGATQADIDAARRALALDELTANILVLKRRARARGARPAIRLPRAQRLGAALLRRLGFELTGAQRRVTREVLLDLERDRPMLRLIQGDVGSGKTVVAAFAAIRAAEHGKQTAIMAPTEILAEQHYANFSMWLAPLGIEVGLLTGQQSASERAARLAGIERGDVHVIVGTHALFQKEVHFASLALVIIDEQHRFGVHQRMALRAKGAEPHQLVMTATPIPRTLTMALYADMDVSLIDELPKGRLPVATRVVGSERRADVLARIVRTCASGQQAYWVCPLIEDSEALDLRAAESTFADLKKSLPKLSIGLMHGKLAARDKARVMADFKSGEIELLVATTVVEVGVDVPNATLMVIENAERLGLAQLHQLRGRVGRGGTQSRCVLVFQAPVSEVARRRLTAMRETHDGFRIAEIDLELRGPGDVLGPRQTGEQQFRVADLARDADLIPRASERAAALLDAPPEAAAALIETWSPGEQDYASV